MMADYLVVGASGFIGTRLVDRLGRDRTVGTYAKRAMPGLVPFDLARDSVRERLLHDHPGITHAFLLGGVTNIDACARDPEGTWRLNVEGMTRAVDDLFEAGIKVLYCSSDAVFDGARGLYTEADSPNPILTYGRHKAALERYLAVKDGGWVVARLSKVVDIREDTHSLFGEWARAIKSGAVIRCAIDQVFSPAAVDEVVTALIRLALEGHEGLFNVCGPRPMSRMELLTDFLESAGPNVRAAARVEPCSLGDLPLAEPRPLNSSMSPAKLYGALRWSLSDMDAICPHAAEAAFGPTGDRKRRLVRGRRN